MSGLPEDWEIIKLEDISQITMGQSPKSDTYNEDNIGIPLIQGNADCKNRKTIPRIYTTELTKECFVGDIIMTVRAPVGAITKSYHNACIGRGVCAIKPKEENEYLYHYLVFYEEKWDKLSQGSTFTAVSGSDIKNLQISLPPLPEKKKIANILSTVDEKIALIDNQIEETEMLKKGLMQKLLTEGIGHGEFKDSEIGRIPVGWRVVKLNDCIKTKGEYGINAAAVEFDENLPVYLRITDIDDNGKFIKNNRKSVDTTDIKQFSLSEGDIVFARTGNTTGKTYLYNKKDGELIFAGFLIKFTPDKNILDSIFLKLFTETNFYWKWVNVTSSRTGQPGINGSEYGAMPLLLPPLKEQKQIAKILSTTDEKLEILRDKKESFQKLKKGLMQKLLTGEIRVKV